MPKLQQSAEYIARNFATLDEYLQLGRKSLPDDGGRNGRKLQGVGTTTHKVGPIHTHGFCISLNACGVRLIDRANGRVY